MNGAGQTLAVVPARSGSKGLPGKNIKKLRDKPLIAWSIMQAKSSAAIDRIIVSTDTQEIADIALSHGGEVPFLRPTNLATDTAKTSDVLIHLIETLKLKENYEPEFVILLQPTSPLRRSEDLTAAKKLLIERKAKAVVSVCEVEHHPWLSGTLPESLCMADFLKPGIQNMRRQDFPNFYRLNGAIYMARTDYFLDLRGFIGPQSYAYVMPTERSIDIDSKLDFIVAESLLSSSNHES